MKKILFLLAFLLPVAFAFTGTADDCSCDEPTNVTKTNETATTISFSWDAMTNATGYVVKWVRQRDSATSGDIDVSSTSYTFANMTAGTYEFYFKAKCGFTTSTAFIVIDDVAGN